MTAIKEKVMKIENEIKEKIEKLRKKFGNSVVKYTWNQKNCKNYSEETFEWFVLEFGKYCYQKGIKETEEMILKAIKPLVTRIEYIEIKQKIKGEK